jgi:nucleoside-diphosphate-sugar epimerase
MRALVTGAAGFVGSHLCEALLADDNAVLGVDAFTDYYDRDRKERNVARLSRSARFKLVEADLVDVPLDLLLFDVDVVYHLAGQPGVRASWGDQFDSYVHHNVLATQKLLEACRGRNIQKLVYASSSSVYGDSESYPTAETLRPQPVSPYGVTKLAAEHLCEVYRTQLGVPTVSLRLFTVYGPRQRPDMAFSRLVQAALQGSGFAMYGDGEQTRDFTFVGDVVDAFLRAGRSSWCGVANIGGGSRSSMNQVVEILTGLCGDIRIQRAPRATGDVRHTAADTSVAAEQLGYRPRTSLAEGLAAMVAAARDEALVGAPA